MRIMRRILSPKSGGRGPGQDVGGNTHCHFGLAIST
jgi:hypothetical protein